MIVYLLGLLVMLLVCYADIVMTSSNPMMLQPLFSNILIPLNTEQLAWSSVRKKTPKFWLPSGYCGFEEVNAIETIIDRVSERSERTSDLAVETEPNGVNLLAVPENEADYEYGALGLAKWIMLFKACGGLVQSPINIDTVSSVLIHHPHLFWWNYNLKPAKMSLVNNGHTVVLAGKWEKKEQTPYFWHSSETGGEENYALHSIHFHWNKQGEHGSEHLINNRGFPLELHAVHYDKKIGGLEAALMTRGVRVVAILFQLSETRNPVLDSIVSALPRIKRPSSVDIEPFEIGKLLTKFSKSYVSYNGSLTTPPCLESVTWIIRLTPTFVSQEQMDSFRQLEDGSGQLLAGNVRPVQPLNGRIIYHIT